MVTELKAKEFEIIVYKEKFYSFTGKDKAKQEYMENTKFHGFTIKGFSDDPDLQRFDTVMASEGFKPEPGKLVVIKRGDQHRIERWPTVDGKYSAVVISASGKL